MLMVLMMAVTVDGVGVGGVGEDGVGGGDGVESCRMYNVTSDLSTCPHHHGHIVAASLWIFCLSYMYQAVKGCVLASSYAALPVAPLAPPPYTIRKGCRQAVSSCCWLTWLCM